MENSSQPSLLTVSQTSSSAVQAKRMSQIPGIILWVLGLAVLITAAWIVHNHPRAWPFELAFSQGIQAWSLPTWLTTATNVITTINDPIPSGILAAIVIAFMFIKRWLR